MRDNICGLEDNNVISKRFWRYVKNTSNSYRIPKTLSLDSTISSDTSVQANLFNQYFYSQFSNESNYNIDMNFENDNDFSISFLTSRVQSQLKNLNVNKACGPDQIPGIVLKRCSNTLAEPLSIIFNTIYNTGMVPSDWKLANVVPIFKKGCYVGSTAIGLSERWRNHKSHIRNNIKSCKLSTHFSECNKHNFNKKTSLKDFDNELRRHLCITLIDTISFDADITNDDKRIQLLKNKESFW